LANPDGAAKTPRNRQGEAQHEKGVHGSEARSLRGCVPPVRHGLKPKKEQPHRRLRPAGLSEKLSLTGSPWGESPALFPHHAGADTDTVHLAAQGKK
jgi:hypothetical protein